MIGFYLVCDVFGDLGNGSDDGTVDDGTVASCLFEFCLFYRTSMIKAARRKLLH